LDGTEPENYTAKRSPHEGSISSEGYDKIAFMGNGGFIFLSRLLSENEDGIFFGKKNENDLILD
jgi:hypothetical protein